MLLCLISALVWIIHSPGQTRHPVTEYTTENGLSLNSVNNLHFDRQGFLWVTTADGLQRFDGYRFQTFKHDEFDKKSIPENSVTEIYEDENNNFWITYRTGICFKPKDKNEFIDITAGMPAPSLKYPLICVHENDSTVFIMHYPYGIYAINKHSLQAKKAYDFTGFSNDDLVVQLSRNRKKGDEVWLRKKHEMSGDLFLVTATGLKTFKNTNKLKLFFLITESKDSIVIISDKSVYKALANDPFKPIRILNTSLEPTELDEQRLNYTRKISNDQHLLLGINKIFVYDGKKEQITVFPHSNYFSSDLIRNFSTATFDQHQNNWLGFDGIGGIKVISLQKFNLFNRPVKNALPYTITSDEHGKIFVGIYYGDIEVYSKDGKYLKKIKLPEAHKKYGSPRAMAMIDSITLIIRSTLNELYAADTRTGLVRILSHLLPARSDSVFRDFEMDIHKANNNEIWLSHSNSILSIKKDRTSFSSTTVLTLPVRESITSFCTQNGFTTWIGTRTGIWLFHNNQFQKINTPITYVKYINPHPDGGIWVATTDGVLVIKNNRVIRHLTTKDGLPNSFVYSILFDDEKNGWVSTNRGLAKITRQNNTSFSILSYSAKEGLQGDEFNTRGSHKSGDGTMYFAGVNGINFFKPRELVSKSEASPTRLTQIEVNNQPYLPSLQPEFINVINLPHRENNIRLSFSCMDFTVPEKNRYRFWLKGFQNDWTLPQKNNTVQYILPVGEYELHVLGANYEGVWSKEPLILKINILPPWYQTNWAKAIFAFLILAIVAAVFYIISRNRYQKKLRKLQMEQEVQKEKQRLSRDLHDNLGSQITWLSNNISQIERAEQENQPVEKKLSQLKEGTGELMQTLRETIWILNKDKISCVELFDKVINHAARHIEAFPPLQLNTEENIGSNIELNSGQALQIFRICQEAINNTSKHAQASQLSIIADSGNNHFSISICDDGKGFDLNNNLEGHYGLQNIKERAKESGLELNFQSSPGQGTSISVTLRL